MQHASGVIVLVIVGSSSGRSGDGWTWFSGDAFSDVLQRTTEGFNADGFAYARDDLGIQSRKFFDAIKRLIGTDDHDLAIGEFWPAQQFLKHRKSIHAWHHDVEQHELRLDGADGDDGVDAVNSLVDGCVRQVSLGNFPQQQHDIRVIVSDQHIELIAHRLALRADGHHVRHVERAAEFAEIAWFDSEVAARKAVGLQMTTNNPTIDRGAANVATLGDFAEAKVIVWRGGHGNSGVTWILYQCPHPRQAGWFQVLRVAQGGQPCRTMRILIVRLGAFGDILHTLPLAADLVRVGHTVSWLCEDRWASVLEGSSAIARIHRLPRKVLRTGSLSARVGAIVTLARELRTADYDVVIDAQGLAKSALAVWLSGASVRLGHGAPRAREGAGLILHRRCFSLSVHVIDQQRDLGKLLGCDPYGPWVFPLPAWQVERHWAATWLAESSVRRPWMLNVGAGWPSKVWPEERQIGFVRALAELGIAVVVVWGSAPERAIAERIIDAADHGVLAPPTNVPQLAGLLSHAAVVISGDTGPLHLALALGVSAVGLFGPVPAERNGPRGRGYRTLQAPGTAWERRDVAKGAMGEIRVDAVIAAADEAISDQR